MSWKNFYPFDNMDEFKKITQNMEGFSSIDEYIKHIFSQTMPPSMFPDLFEEKEKKNPNKQKKEEIEKKKLEYQIFDLHDFVIVRIPIDRKINVSELKIYHTSSLLTVKGIPNKKDKHEIPLPALVKHKKTRTKFKNRILEITMPKVQDNRYTEINF